MKTEPAKLAPLKAYHVQGDEYGCIVFAKSGVVARREGANELNLEFRQVESCRRKPSLDGYADVKGGVPMRVLVEDHGWWQECFCGQLVDAECNPERVWDGDQVFCDQACADKSEQGA